MEERQRRLGRRIRELRRARRMSQGELASEAGVAMLTIFRLEHGQHDPHVRTLWRVAGALGVPMLELMASAGYAQEGDAEAEGG